MCSAIVILRSFHPNYYYVRFHAPNILFAITIYYLPFG